MKNTHPLPLCLLVSLFLLAGAGCTKNGKSGALDFSYSGTLNAGYPVTFLPSVHGAASYVWVFGDGSRSTDANPNHTYWSAGSYTVTLTVNNDSARKVSKTITIDPAFSFTYSGIPTAGSTLTFTSTAPAGSSFLWNFGDGSSSSTATPSHFYSANGSFNVSLVLNNDSGHIIRNTVLVFAGAIYTGSIAGTRLFHHTYTDAYPWPPYHTTYTMADTLISITSLSPSVIIFGWDTLGYTRSQQGDSVLDFNGGNFYTGTYNTLYYNHFDSSINYYKDKHISAGAGDATDRYFLP